MADERVLVALRSIGISDPDELARAVEVVGAATAGAPPAASRADTSALHAALADGEDKVAMVGEEAFRVRPIRGGTFMRFSAALGSEDPLVMGTAVGKMVAAIVDPADAERLYNAMDALGWDVDEAMEWFANNIETATGRPTQPPSLSPARRPKTSGSSNGDSPPTATP